MLQPWGPKSLPDQEEHHTILVADEAFPRIENLTCPFPKKNVVAMTIKFSIQNWKWIYD
jgi:hypothetical protein